MAQSWCPCYPPLHSPFLSHLHSSFFYTSTRLSCACLWKPLVKASWKGDSALINWIPWQSPQSSAQCLSAPLKLYAETGDTFTAVSKFIMAYIAFVAVVSIGFFCNVTSPGIVCIRRGKTIQVIFPFYALCKLFMRYSVGHLAKITLGHPCSHIEPGECLNFSHFCSMLEHHTEICL